MPRKKSSKAMHQSIQLVVRVPEVLERDLMLAAEGLGLDQSNLVRMILTEHVAEYIERGQGALVRTKAARKKKARPSKPSNSPPASPEGGDKARKVATRKELPGKRPGLDM